MLTLNLKPLFLARGIKKPYSWFIESDFPETAARRLSANDYKEVPLVYLERLCLLLRCTPNDILSWKPERSGYEGHPMTALMPQEETGLEWMSELNNLPLEELRAMGARLKAAKEG